jgi:crotonobetainyl-CoA:carnitine CoA-transferase CaiB-like acyl-CoA transferase
VLDTVKDIMKAHLTAQNPSARPLDGIRVLDFTRVLSGPHCARMLSDLGAEVIKIEPPEGDLTRFAFPRVGSMSTYFAQQNIGKLNMSMNLKKPEAIALVKGLVAQSDVLIENYRGGVMESLGLGYDVLAEINPRLIYASITGYGTTGPWAHRRAYATVINAETGMTGIQADARNGELSNDPHSHADVYTGMETAAGILAALFQREHSGVGQHLDVSMAQTMLYVNEHTQNELYEEDVPADLIRSFQPGDYPILTTGNGTLVVVSGHPAERGTFDLFAKAMKRPDMLTDPRFDTVAKRLANLAELQQVVRDWALTVQTAEEIEDTFAEAGLAMGVLRKMTELAETDWAHDRNAIISIDDRSGGTFRIPNSPWQFSGADVSTQGIPKFRGEDNAEVLQRLLGISAEEVAALTESGALSIRLPKN